MPRNDWSAIKSLYDAGKYSEALGQTDLKNLGRADEFCNAGLILYKNNQPEKAYAYFLKAKILAPANDDIARNLAVAGQRIRAPSHDAPALAAKTMNPALVGAPLGLLFLAAGVCFRKTRRTQAIDRATPPSKIPAFWAGLFSLLSGLAVAAGYWRFRSEPLFVVQAETTEARSGPAETFSAIGKIGAGAIVEAAGDARGDAGGTRWRQIEFGKDGLGWAREEDLLAL